MSVRRIMAGLKSKSRAHRGVTLVELLIAVIAFGILCMGVIGFYRSQRSALMQRAAASDVQHNLREVMAELATQIRQAGCSVQGAPAALVIGRAQDMLLVHYHDGDSVRARIFFLLTDSLGRSNLMTLIDGETPRLFAAGIDSLRFGTGGDDGKVHWVTVNLVARAASGSAQTAATPGGDASRFRHLYSTIKLKNS